MLPVIIMLYQKMEDVIGKKLHFAERELRSDIIPPGTTELGDWAYAQCSALEWIALPVSVHMLGKDVFRGCSALKYAYYYDHDDFSLENVSEESHGIAALNALALRYFREPLSVLLPSELPSEGELLSWDLCCFEYLGQPDDLGFAPFMAGGEEDYEENEEQLESFRNRRQRLKALIIYTRLLAEQAGSLPFDKDNKEKYNRLFRSCPEAFPLLDRIDSHYEESAKIYAEAGLLTPETLQDVLSTLNPSNVKMRSALIRDLSADPFARLSL